MPHNQKPLGTGQKQKAFWEAAKMFLKRLFCWHDFQILCVLDWANVRRGKVQCSRCGKRWSVLVLGSHSWVTCRWDKEIWALAESGMLPGAKIWTPGFSPVPNDLQAQSNVPQRYPD